MTVQRWAADWQSLRKITPEGVESPPWDEVVVKYEDHVAALAEQASTELATAKEWLATRDEAWYEGYAEALRQAREAVDAERRAYYADCVNDGRQPDPTTIATFRLSLAAIDALKGEQA